MPIEEEERNGMFINYNYQAVFNGNTTSWMQTYDKIHSRLHDIAINMTVVKLLVDQRLATSFLNFLRTVMCQLQATLKLDSFTEENTHLQVRCRRSLTISRDIENAQSTHIRINFSIQSLLTARDALNEIYNVIKFDNIWKYLQF
ncbi:hypothetical protein CHS0354_014227 [Potamilus streckersoni]|uniref:Uncharacterized protein n=1 Tax=Potamilus streckersoni TaxID=2493646 RepID=A0AAE0SZ59_9BIVA|nr:hypothetical protein CHS0354_014227 [Potamilus streckersoni]